MGVCIPAWVELSWEHGLRECTRIASWAQVTHGSGEQWGGWDAGVQGGVRRGPVGQRTEEGPPGVGRSLREGSAAGASWGHDELTEAHGGRGRHAGRWLRAQGGRGLGYGWELKYTDSCANPASMRAARGPPTAPSKHARLAKETENGKPPWRSLDGALGRCPRKTCSFRQTPAPFWEPVAAEPRSSAAPAAHTPDGPEHCLLPFSRSLRSGGSGPPTRMSQLWRVVGGGSSTPGVPG